MTVSFDNAPSDWKLTALKYLFHVQSGEMISADRESPDGYPIIGGNGLRGYTTEFNTKGPRLVIGRVGAKCGCIHIIEEDFWASEHAFVVYPRREYSMRYMRYLLEALDLNSQAIRTAQPLINTEIVESTKAAIPSLSEQQQISRFLDFHISSIDNIILAKQRLLNLLTEKRRALITQAVTKGLDSSVKMKDLGIPWLSVIPTHWSIERSKWLLKERDERSELGEEELLTVSHLTGVTTRAEKDVNMFMAESLEGYKCCKRGDLVINTLWAWMGAMGVARQDGIVSPAYHVYEPGPNIDPDYIDYLVRMPVFTEEVTRYSKGVWSSRLRLYPEGLYEVWFPVPPIDEQRAIVAHLKTETAKLSNLATATERTIKLLQERRTALISDAVTGKIPSEFMNLKIEENHAY